MDITEYRNIYVHEQNHFFYVSTFGLVVALTEKYLGKGNNLKILDAGCGTGLLAKKLTRFGEVSAFDFSSEAIRWSKKRGIKAKKGSIEEIPFDNNSFDLVTCIDVLVHNSISSDQKAIAELWRVIKPGGYLIMRVAANPYLTMRHDELVHSTKRYRIDELERKLVEAKFEVAKLSYTHFSLWLPMVIKKMYEVIFRPRPSSSVFDLPKSVNWVISKELLFENKIIVGNRLPFGIGLVAVCKKS